MKTEPHSWKQPPPTPPLTFLSPSYLPALKGNQNARHTIQCYSSPSVCDTILKAFDQAALTSSAPSPLQSLTPYFLLFFKIIGGPGHSPPWVQPGSLSLHGKQNILFLFYFVRKNSERNLDFREFFFFFWHFNTWGKNVWLIFLARTQNPKVSK